VFETTLRLWDVIGQWVDWREYGVSDIVQGKPDKPGAKKWFGLRWEDINDDLVLHYTPSKTSMKTGLAITFPLRMAPMVIEELENWPQDARQGPVIVNAKTGLPYSAIRFDELWRRDRKAAGISDKVWARDLRASGITEGRAAGVLTDDVAKVAGHSSTRTTSEIYDRAALEAAERFAEARVEKRKKNA
jgi:integrase